MGAGASAPVFEWASFFFVLFVSCCSSSFWVDVVRYFFACFFLFISHAAFAVDPLWDAQWTSSEQACLTEYHDDFLSTVPGTPTAKCTNGEIITLTCSSGTLSGSAPYTCVSSSSCGAAGSSGVDFGWAAGYTPYPPGASTSISEVQGFNLPPSSVCIGGCTYSRGDPYGVFGDQSPNSSGQYSITVNFHSTSSGSSCTGGDTPGAVSPGAGTPSAQTGPSDGNGCSGNQITCSPGPGNTCPKGSAPEVVGGSVTCVNYNLPGSGGSQTSSQNTSSSSAPPGTSASAPGTYQNSTSSGSGDTRTTNTTTTTVGADGSTNTTTTACTGSDCGNCTYTGPGSCGTTPNSFSGDCSAGFAAGGDAVADATATAANLINCALKPDTTDATYTLGKSMMSGTDSGASSPSSTVDFSSGMTFDQSDPFSESGLQDFSVSLAGQTLLVPMSNANGVLNALGLLFVAGTLIWAAWFVIEGV